MKFKSAIIALALVLPMQTRADTCSSDEISRMDVATGCDCATSFPDTNCGDCPLQPCGSPQKVITPKGMLKTCSHGCVNSNDECDACFLWFKSLCNCIKRLENGDNTDCISSDDLSQGPPNHPIWMLLNSRTLITTTQLVPGILELDQVKDSDGGFRLGQQVLQQNLKFSRVYGALALNSVYTRNEEQIHIHLCDVQMSKLRDLLSSLKRSDYNTLSSVTLPTTDFKHGSAMSCRIASAPGTIIDVARDLNHYLQSTVAKAPQSCDQYYVGAGVITDWYDHSWACVTTGTRSAEELFCHT
ncbi:hypothetical protein V499_03887 [Pseudogymnoascus sp. VKM F-103]|uniref:CDP-diacylglycerol phosphatidylhydrolase n=1 Tax=Pseudogymnoascus verrucosus TaxID=342668 RepID=A0A1B8G8P2_9PEZI|nr:uncharacterized protein VE01_09981 [Pseudogymnoascus verrucosus]KFY76465.1 hypothetical protein V499_03887 [Pseudogymnoascus sp. VKM F-103]OBT92210.2 hypothetical protein VE01_09981 [Pseudogymnoascus verrucosus]